jgi:1-acyl-sn-glycerol-3-phosphate acyltransferase
MNGGGYKLGGLLRASIASTGCGNEIADEIDEKIAHIPVDLNEYGYDPWGFNPKVFRDFILPAALMYRYWFRCITNGVDNVPEGRCMLIGNHAGQVAFDGLMITAAMVLEAHPPRLTRSMGEYWLGTLPWLSVLLDRIGSSVGTPQTCADMLNSGECILAFPEGIRGMNKLYADAYQLQEFGLGFMRLALQTNTPIVPFAVVGSEEQAPSIANLKGIGNLFGAPAFPITLTWPWLGPLGMVPLPVRYHIEFGKPLHFEGAANDEDEIIAEKVDEVKTNIQAMIRDALARRSSIFF